MYGAETELDRQVLELVKDPLTHLVRNCADHGIESPAEQIAAGKPRAGTIRLSACHQGGHIIIEISDDGRGLDTARIKARALEIGLVNEAEMAAKSDGEISNIIFSPGFSTAVQVTSISGRGVGMDVVRNNIEQIGGTVDLKSVAGAGTSFTIKIPLTLAIVSSLVVEAGGERFAIPQLSVLELVRAGGGGEHRIERIKDTPVLRLRNTLLPLLHLREVLHLGAPDGDNGFVVVTQVGSQIFGIVVDGVFHTEEIVIKPMSSKLRHIATFSGTTILGDGSVIMILDPNGVAQALGRGTQVAAQADARERKRSEEVVREDTVSLLVFRAGSQQPKAVPLSLVTRLEEIDCRRIEVSDGRHLVQYRDQLMPLLRIDTATGLKQDGAQPILVFSANGRSMGLVVDEIVDIVEDKLHIEVASNRPGVLGYAVVKGNTTEIVDVGHFLPQAFEDWFRRRDDAVPAARAVLLVDEFSFLPRPPGAADQGRRLLGHGRRFGRRGAGGAASRCPLRSRRDRHRDAGHGWFCARRDDAGDTGLSRHSHHRAGHDGFRRSDRARTRRRLPRFRRQVRPGRTDRGHQGTKRRHRAGSVTVMNNSSSLTEYVTFTTAGQLFGLPIGCVQDVFKPANITCVPLAGPEIAGVLNLRGRIVTAIHLSNRLALQSRAERMTPMAIGIESGAESFGLLVDAVGEVLKLPDSDREANPVNLDRKLARVSAGVFRLDGQLLVVLDIDRVLDLGGEAAAA